MNAAGSTTNQPSDDAMALIERLVAALEMREAADPDCPAWLAEREIRLLEREILVTWPRHADLLLLGRDAARLLAH
jgi:hypothetical protein